MNANQQKRAQEVMDSLITKCWEDDAFKQKLITSPAKTIEQFTGKSFNLPTGKELLVHDQTDESIIYINIPGKVDFSDLQLTDEQLEAVAGGLFPAIVYGGIFLGSVALGYYSGD